MATGSGSKGRRSRSSEQDGIELKDIHKIDVAFNKLITVVAAGAGVGFGSVALAALPRGEFVLLPSVLYIAFSEDPKTANISETWSGDFSIGTAATADVTLSGAEVDLFASAALDVATLGNFARARKALLLGNTIVDNNAGTKGVFLNLLIDAADIADATSPTVRVSGQLKMACIPYGKLA